MNIILNGNKLNTEEIQKKSKNLLQIPSLFSNTQKTTTLQNCIILKDLHRERKQIKSNRFKEEESPLKTIYRKKINSKYINEKEISICKNKIDLTGREHLKMRDLEELEEDWKQMKIQHEKKNPNVKEKSSSENYDNQNFKMLKHLVPRSKINLQIKEDSNILSKSLNDNDLLKTNFIDEHQIKNTSRDYTCNEIENLLPINTSTTENKNNQANSTKDFKNQLYMRTIFDKYSNIYQKKIPEASKIGHYFYFLFYKFYYRKNT